jgi:hypothetical protein
MTTSPHSDKSIGHSRSSEWTEILDIVENVCRMNLGGTTTPLNVDQSIRPDLPTSEECIRSLTTRLEQPLLPSLTKFLQVRVDRLRQQMLLSYTETISQMASFSTFTGRDDSDEQREHSRSIEIWFDQAIEELFTTLIKRLKVCQQSFLF